MKKICLGVLILFVSIAFLSADIYIQQKTHSDAFTVMGQTTPAKDEVNHIWLGDNKMAMHMKTMSYIIDLDKNVMYWLIHANKNYLEMGLPLDLNEIFPAQMMQMMGSIDVKVTPTGETRKINQWNCQGYDVDMSVMMMNMKTKAWASTEVPFKWEEYMEKMYPYVAQAMMRLSDDALKEYAKIKGWQIRSDTTVKMMGNDMKSWVEVAEIAKKDAPAGTYSVPEGYQKKEKLSMMDMQNLNR